MEEIHTFTNTFAWKYICGFFSLVILALFERDVKNFLLLFSLQDLTFDAIGAIICFTV